MKKKEEITLNKDEVLVKVNEFICETEEDAYWLIKHLERYKEIAKDNKVFLKAVIYFLKRVS